MRIFLFTTVILGVLTGSLVRPAHPQSAEPGAALDPRPVSAATTREQGGGTGERGADSGLLLERPSRAGAFLSVVGRRSAFLGYEHRGLEAWVFPLKLLDDLRLAFRIEGYPLEIDGQDALARIAARPEETVLTFSHAAFTARARLFAPVHEPALVMLVELDATLPVSVTVSFRPRLRLMWPAGLQTGNIGWNDGERVYEITEESGRYAGLVGSPSATGASLMPYQEEPRDVPVRFDIPASGPDARGEVPIVIAAGVEGLPDARRTYRRVLETIPALRAANAEYYRGLLGRTVAVDTPDDRLDEAFAWAKAGIDKGVVSNPLLGTGLVAGYRTSGDSERPGYAWYFGRDALWTSLAITAYGDLETARTALAFLGGFQREDGKIPHEISQSASLIPWFTDYPYAWASADATPLFVIAHADYWRASGDRRFLEESWPRIVKAWEFSSATDTDRDALIENTSVGHGWVEGGALYPPHEEIYLQGTWIAAQQAIAELASVMGQPDVAARASAGAARTQEATERTYWDDSSAEYLYATKLPRTERVVAEPGPSRDRRQARLDAIANRPMYEESTVLPAVPMWWGVLRADRSDRAIDVLGSGALATDWGHRLLSSRSALYDPLSYHYGSVWPLFTGWASVGAYRYGRPHVGYQALMANALLTRANALGYVTELLSGAFQAPFGRSSHHQIWSEAMIVAPLVRGLLGVEGARDAEGRPTLTISPQLPADWDDVSVTGLAMRGPDGREARYALRVTRRGDVRRFDLVRTGDTVAGTLVVRPALPLDAVVDGVRLNSGRHLRPVIVRRGDVQFASVTLDTAAAGERASVEFQVRGGTDVHRTIEAVPAGASSRGLRVLRSRAGADGLELRLEGLSGHPQVLHVRTARRLGDLPAGVRRVAGEGGSGGAALEFTFDGTPGEYVRRDVVIPLR